MEVRSEILAGSTGDVPGTRGDGHPAGRVCLADDQPVERELSDDERGEHAGAHRERAVWYV